MINLSEPISSSVKQDKTSMDYREFNEIMYIMSLALGKHSEFESY